LIKFKDLKTYYNCVVSTCTRLRFKIVNAIPEKFYYGAVPPSFRCSKGSLKWINYRGLLPAKDVIKSRLPFRQYPDLHGYSPTDWNDALY